MDSYWLLIVLLLILGALAFVLLRKRPTAESAQAAASKTSPPPFNAPPANWAAPAPSQAPPASHHTAGTADPDQQVLEQLRAAGSDLSKPHEMEFYLYFPTEEAAQQAGMKLEVDGFDGEVRRAPNRADWLCLVYKQMVPERAKLAALRKRFNALARELGGEYDGWETSIVQ